MFEDFLEVRESKSPFFFGRLVHSGGWQDRIKDFMSGKTNTVMKEGGKKLHATESVVDFTAN